MDSAGALLATAGEHAWPVAAVASIVFLFRTRLVRAVCWNLVLRALNVPIQERRSIVTQVARRDLDVPRPRTRPKPAPAARDVPCKDKASSTTADALSVANSTQPPRP